MRIKSQQGAALIVALFIMSLIAILATAMMSRLSLDISRTELVLNTNSANLIAEEALAMAIDVLKQNWLNQQANQLVDRMPQQLPNFEKNGIKVQTTLYDMQGNFNLNSLSNDYGQKQFTHLLQIVEPELASQTAREITLATLDWISLHSQTNIYNQYYAKLNPAYRAPHQPMVSSSELRLVKGMTPTLYAKLLPYITALPEPTTININQAPLPIVMTLSTNLTQSAAETLLSERRLSPFTSQEKFINSDVAKNHGITAEQITVTSQYFLVKSKLDIGKQAIILYTAVHRIIKDSQPFITILWQSFGTPSC